MRKPPYIADLITLGGAVVSWIRKPQNQATKSCLSLFPWSPPSLLSSWGSLPGIDGVWGTWWARGCCSMGLAFVILQSKLQD